MKIFALIMSCIFVLSICVQLSNAWASHGREVAIGGIFIGVIAIFVAQVLSRSYSLKSGLGYVFPAEEKAAMSRLEAIKKIERFPDTALRVQYAPEQNFELKAISSNRSPMFGIAILAELPVVLWPCFMKSLQTELAFLLFTSIMAGLAIYILSRPRSFKVTPEALLIGRWWPYSSVVIYLGEIERINLNWMPELVTNWDNYPLPTGLNYIDDISFILKNGKKYRFQLGVFFPTSVEKLILFLNNSGVEARIASTQY